MKQVKGWWLPDTDTDFDRWILDGEYQKKQRDAILEFVNKDGNAIDIGVNNLNTFMPLSPQKKLDNVQQKMLVLKITPHILLAQALRMKI